MIITFNTSFIPASIYADSIEVRIRGNVQNSLNYFLNN